MPEVVAEAGGEEVEEGLDGGVLAAVGVAWGKGVEQVMLEF